MVMQMRSRCNLPDVTYSSSVINGPPLYILRSWCIVIIPAGLSTVNDHAHGSRVCVCVCRLAVT